MFSYTKDTLNKIIIIIILIVSIHSNEVANKSGWSEVLTNNAFISNHHIISTI